MVHQPLLIIQLNYSVKFWMITLLSKGIVILLALIILKVLRSSSGNIPDLVFINNDSLIEETAVYPYTFDSDHFPVCFTNKNKFHRPRNGIRKVYCHGKADFDGLRNTLFYVSWDSFISCDDMNSSVANFQDLLLAAVDQHVPLMKLRRNSSPPWIDKAVLKLRKRKLYRDSCRTMFH